MKKVLSILLIAILMFSLSGCIINNGGFVVSEADGVTTIELDKFAGQKIFEIPHEESDGETLYYIIDVEEGEILYGVSGTKASFGSYMVDVANADSESEVRIFHIDSAEKNVYFMLETYSVSGTIRLSYDKNDFVSE